MGMKAMGQASDGASRISTRKMNGRDIANIEFYQIQKWVFEKFIEKEITPGAFQTYILMYDRLRLSDMNRFKDDNGDIYIKYSYAEMQDRLKLTSKEQINRNLKSLIDSGLIIKRRHYSASNSYYLTTLQ